MNVTLDPYATYKLLAVELKERGYSYAESHTPKGRLEVSFTRPDGYVWTTEAAHIRYPFINDATTRLFDDKKAAYEFVRQLGISTPYTHQVAESEMLSVEDSKRLLGDYTPLIVKPNNSSLSKGLTLNITTEASLSSAVEHAKSIKGSEVLIQEQVQGEEIRFIIVDHKVVSALLRQTPRIVGDGLHSIKELLNKENTERESLKFPYISYPQLSADQISSDLFESNEILRNGEVLELNHATMIKKGCSVYDVVGSIHSSYIEMVESLAASIDSPFIATDVLISNFDVPLTANNYWFLEFNCAPVLKLCYGCRDGKMFDIVPTLADLLDEHK